MLASLFPNSYRKYLLSRVSAPGLKSYLQTPLPSPRQTLDETEFLALDFETSGLDPKKDEILSVGYSLIKHGRILLRENGHHLLKPQADISATSVAIHGITDDDAQQGISLPEILNILLEKMAGRILIAHNAVIEQTFFDCVCQQYFGHTVPFRIIDTLKIEQKRLTRQHQHPNATQLRLFNLRNQYNLPRYKAHNALQDAIATAELFLAMAHHYCHDLNSCKLREFI